MNFSLAYDIDAFKQFKCAFIHNIYETQELFLSLKIANLYQFYENHEMNLKNIFLQTQITISVKKTSKIKFHQIKNL